jgi:DNA-binding transcriptional ArsR family regulator
VDPEAEPSLEDRKLAEMMAALSSPVRLRLLRLLRQPRSAAEIRLAQAASGSDRTTLMSQVAVRKHLAQLIELGLVRQVPGTREGRTVALHIVNHKQLFALTEELGTLVRLAPEEDPLPEMTRVAAPAKGPTAAHGPALVIINGVHEGRSFRLDGAGTCRIGRRRGHAVCLDYDPYLSLDNSEVVPEDGHFVLRDLASSRNGTRVNWQALPPGGAHRLAAGDVIGVGRSLILFRA